MGIFHHPPPPLMGAAQPHTPRKLTPALVSVAADQPPFTTGGPAVIISAIAAIAQPDPWTYNLGGGFGPFLPRWLPSAIPAVRTDNPPFTYGGPVVAQQEVAYLAQPDPWTFNFSGGPQPFEGLQAAPGVPGQSVEDPPFTSPGRTATTASIVAMLQPDPWTYTYGGPQPFEPKKNSSAIPGQSKDPPPFSQRRAETAAELIALTQPDPWTFNYPGAAQPFAPRTLSPGIPGQSADPPPPQARIAELRAEAISLTQPDPWTYSFEGGRQPYAPRKLNPSDFSVAVDLPPFGSTQRTSQIASIVQMTQPDPWTYAFAGGSQPYQPRWLARNFVSYSFPVVIVGRGNEDDVE